MLLAEISMWPMDKGESVGAYVAPLLDIIDRSGLAYRLGPLGTSIEGEWDDVMSVLRQCFEHLAQGLQPDRLHRENGLAKGKERDARQQDPISRAEARPKAQNVTGPVPNSASVCTCCAHSPT